VNTYLREIAGDEFTAKDFRTWAGTLLAARLLDEYPAVESVAAAKAACANAVKEVAHQLGNTPAICRKCYIHPAILDGFLDEQKLALWKKTSAAANERAGLSRHEVALLRYLEASQRAG
jgi:DNA topoisomerase-1